MHALDIVERVPVASCVRRGPAIDLVLVRGINKRSQFVLPIVFAESRKFAEEWTFRFLRAARANAQAPELTGVTEVPLVPPPPPAPPALRKKRGRPRKARTTEE